MVDYYAELNLNRSLPLADLRRELTRTESVWKKRRTTSPAAANRKLVLVDEARRVFATEASRADYDRRLAEGDEAPDTSERTSEFEHWRSEAARYLESGQHDLAAAAIEHALSCPDAQSADADFHILACRTFNGTGDTGRAMRHANEAILLEPNDPAPCLYKALVLDQIGSAQRQSQRQQEALRTEEQLRALLLQAASLADGAGRDQIRGTALGCYAFSLYHHDPTDLAQAELHARRAVRLGDLWGNAQQTLDEIAKNRKAQAEQELRRRREAARQAKERADRELARKKAEEEQQRKADEASRKEEAARTTKGFYRLFTAIGWILLLVCAYLVIRPAADPSGGTFDQRMAAYDFEQSRVLLAVALAWLHTFDTASHNGDGGLSTFLGMVLAVPHAFLVATARYTQMGFNSISAGEAWKTFGVTLAIYIAVIWACSRIGKALSKGTL